MKFIFYVILSFGLSPQAAEFGKALDQSLLTQAYALNFFELQKMIQNSGVSVEIKNFEDETLGLYLPHLILLDVKAKKWTLIHEWTHHLFDLGRAKQKIDESALANQILDGREDYLSNYTKLKGNQFRFLNTEHENTMLSDLLELVKSEIQFQILFVLEEVAVDDLLRTAYSKNQITEIDPQDFDNSLNYMKQNLTKAQNSFLWLRGHIEVIKKGASVKHQHELQMMQDQLNSLLSKISQTLERNQFLQDEVLKARLKP